MSTPDRLFDASEECHSSNCCVVADEQPDGTVRVHDPDQPDRGSFVFTKEEYNALLKRGKPAA